MHILAPTPVTRLPGDQESRTARLMAEAAMIFLEAAAALCPFTSNQTQSGWAPARV